MRLVPTTPRPATPKRSGFAIDVLAPLSGDNSDWSLVPELRSRINEAWDRSAVPLGGGLLLLLALLAGGVAGVALELPLVLEPLLILPQTLGLGLAGERLEPQLLLPRRFLGGVASGFGRPLFRLALARARRRETRAPRESPCASPRARSPRGRPDHVWSWRGISRPSPCAPWRLPPGGQRSCYRS